VTDPEESPELGPDEPETGLEESEAPVADLDLDEDTETEADPDDDGK
jgi:hypothetical protein